MGGGTERRGSGDGRTPGAPFRDNPPPPPRLSRKGALESGEFNKRTPSRQPGGGGGGLSRKGVLSSLLYQPFIFMFYLFIPIFIFC